MSVNHTPLPWTVEIFDANKHEHHLGVYVVLEAQTSPYANWDAMRAQNEANAEALQIAVNNHAALVAAEKAKEI